MDISKKRWFGAGLALAAAAALLPAVVVAQTTSRFEARLTGANEVPAVTTTAAGTFSATLDEAAGTLTWSLSVPTITSATAAHLHAGAAGANGGIVLPLFAAPTAGPVSTINVSGTARVADLSGTLAGNFAGFVSALKAGTLYVNVHTTANPGGEIRAQVAGAAAPIPTLITAPAKTGNGGPEAAETGSAGFAVIGLIAMAVVAVGGARILTARKR